MSDIAAIAEAPGACLGFGGTNARRAVCENGDIRAARPVPTPENPKLFFDWMANYALEASHEGASWLVAGFPGPVSQDGLLVGPMVNVQGMSKQRYNLRQELEKADPEVGKILEQGFQLLAVNDGTLAAQAVALRVAETKHNRVAALINGTGTGTGVVERDPAQKHIFRVDDSMPYEIGHLLMFGSGPKDTMENRISGPAIEARYGAELRKLVPGHPAWQEIGLGLGRLATTLGLMSNVELVVPTGGVGAGASNGYRAHLEAFMDKYTSDDNDNEAQKGLAPEIRFIDPAEADDFEMYGALGVIRDYATRVAA